MFGSSDGHALPLLRQQAQRHDIDTWLGEWVRICDTYLVQVVIVPVRLDAAGLLGVEELHIGPRNDPALLVHHMGDQLLYRLAMLQGDSPSWAWRHFALDAGEVRTLPRRFAGINRQLDHVSDYKIRRRDAALRQVRYRCVGS